MGVCIEWEQAWCIMWSATWLPLGLDCLPRGLGSGEGRRGEWGVSRGRAKLDVLALASLPMATCG